MDLRQKVPFFMNYASGYIDTVTGDSPLLLPKAKANGLKSVTAYGAIKQGVLPVGYTQLSYIESEGSGHIDTGIVLNTFDLDVECDLQFTDTSSTGPAMAWGYMGGSSNLPRWGFGFYNTGWLGSVNATSAVGNKDTDRHTAILSTKLNDQNQAIYEATVDTTSYYGTTITSSSTFEGNTLSTYLFARNNNGTVGNRASCKIYGFKVTKAGVVTHNLVPCKNSSNTLGMYDTVTNTFKAATGTLTAGAAIVPTPDAPMDIVSNNGVIKVNSQGQIYTDGTQETIKDNLNNTATAEMLLSFGEDYKDTQEILTGAIARNVGVKVLDGTETTSWTVQSNRAYALKSNLGMSKCVQPSGTGTSSLLCSHFSSNTINNYGNVLFNYTMSNIGVSDVTSWNNYLATQYANGTPVIVVYPLNSTDTSSVTGQTLQVQADDNTLTATGSISPLQLSATYKKEKGTPTPRYNVGKPSFLMRFDGSFKYYSDGSITAELVNSPSLTTGGPWGLGALDQTYYAQDTSIRRSVKVNMTAAQQTSQSFFIEYWARLDNTDQSVYQTFLGNIIHPDTTYSGWSFRWWPRTGGNTSVLSMFVGNGTSTTANSYNELGYNQAIQGNTQGEWATCCEAVKNSWCHYAIYFNKANTRVQFYINGRCFYEQSTAVYNAALTNPQPNFLISDAKYGTGYTLSPMAEVRVLLGQNADDYATTIQTGTHIGGYGTFDYTVPTASFADGGLTQYTAS